MAAACGRDELDVNDGEGTRVIVVIADDFSGAAEIAGEAVSAGYRAEVQRDWTPRAEADLLVVDTDSRLLPPQAAAERLLRLGERLTRHGVTRIFKKVDSVLRGPVSAELQALTLALGRGRWLLAPANPQRGRILRRGHYLIDGQPLEQTLFAADPGHPARSSAVLQRLGATADVPCCSLPVGTPLPATGGAVADAESTADLESWVGLGDANTLPAGAVEFFRAWLSRQPRPGLRAEVRELPVQLPRQHVLLVCGSLAAWQQGRPVDCQRYGIPVVELTFDSALSATEGVDVEAARHAYAERGWLAVTCATALPPPAVAAEDHTRTPFDPLAQLAAFTVRWLQRETVECLLVEGGATAAALVQQLGLLRWRAGPPLAPGITPLWPVDGPPWMLVSKPGSYAWPAGVWPNSI